MQKNRLVQGFSLIEVSMVLVIMGVMMGAVFKGHDLVEQARIRSTSYDFSRIWTALQLYANDYQTVLWGDPDAWTKLADARLLASPEAPRSKLGGQFSLETKDDVGYLRLGQGSEAKAFLSFGQVKSLLACLKNDNPQRVVVMNQSGAVVDLDKETEKGGRYSVALVLE